MEPSARNQLEGERKALSRVQRSFRRLIRIMARESHFAQFWRRFRRRGVLSMRAIATQLTKERYPPWL